MNKLHELDLALISTVRSIDQLENGLLDILRNVIVIHDLEPDSSQVFNFEIVRSEGSALNIT